MNHIPKQKDSLESLLNMISHKNLLLLSFIGISILACSTTTQSINTNNYINNANLLLKQSQANAALESANMAIKQDPHNGYGWLVQAKSYQQLQDYKAAETSYLRAIDIDDDNVEFRLAYANFFCATQKYPQADLNYQQAAKLAANNESELNSVYISHGDCYTSQNNLESAIDSYSQVLSKPNPPLAAYLGITYAYILQNNYPRASYFISSYDGAVTPELLQMKITALSGLKGANLSAKNKKILANRIKQLKQQLAAFDQPSATSQSTEDSQIIAIKPTVSTKINNDKIKSSSSTNKIVSTNTTLANAAPKAVTTKSDKAQSKANTPIKTKSIQAHSSFKSRIKASPHGKHYIVIEAGDTLYNIAEKSHVSSTKLIKLNHLKTDYVPLGTKFFLD